MKETIHYVNNAANIFDHFGVDQVVTAAGLCVIEKYRGCGIATKILQARAPLLKTIGLQVTSSVFTTIGAQKAAKAAGYEEVYSISYEELNEKFPRMDFSHVAGGFCKILALKV